MGEECSRDVSTRRKRLTEEEKTSIMQMLAAGEKHRVIAEAFNLDVMYISAFKAKHKARIMEMQGLNIDGTPKPRVVEEGVRAITADDPCVVNAIEPVEESVKTEPRGDYFPGSPSWRCDMLRRLNALIQETEIVLGNLNTDYDGIVFQLENARLSAFIDMIDWEAIADAN